MNTYSKKITEKSSHRRPFSPFYLRKCLTNSGRYILSHGTEENSDAIYGGNETHPEAGLDWSPRQ